MASVTFTDVEKRYGDVPVIDRLNLEVRDREFMVLVGRDAALHLDPPDNRAGRGKPRPYDTQFIEFVRAVGAALGPPGVVEPIRYSSSTAPFDWITRV